jgi:hypothetical protein
LYCGSALIETENIPSKRRNPKRRILRRIAVFLFAAGFAVVGFYLSLVLSAERLSLDESRALNKAIAVLDEKGFHEETFLLKYFAVYRSTDHWLNVSVEKENAYAATNFPLEIMTLYDDFFRYPMDEVERAAILLHEAKHLEGADEKEAYEFVWNNRARLGWSREKYRDSVIWQHVRTQTREYVPNLFVCNFNEFNDCTESRPAILQTARKPKSKTQ